MRFLSWLRNGTLSLAHASGRAHGAPRQRATFRPSVEALEGRNVPSTLTVTNNLDTGVAGDGSLRGEIATAQSGDTIVFDPSLAGQNIFLYPDELVINKSLTIQGPAAPLAPVTISSLLRVFEVDGASTQVALSNLAITGDGTSGGAPGAAAPNGQGGAIWNDGILTLTACNLSNSFCHAFGGNYGGPDGLGGAIYNAGTLTLNTCNLSSNQCAGIAGLGGAIYNAGTLAVNNSTLSGNSAGAYPPDVAEEPRDGGAIYNAGTMSVTDSILSGNQALGGYGSGIGYGGGIFNALNASATVTGSSLSDNVAEDTGGGIYNDGTMTLSGSTVSSDLTPDGGGIFNDKKGRLTIQAKCSITDNFSYALSNLGWVKISKDSYVG
jgi:hypothetical protein